MICGVPQPPWILHLTLYHRSTADPLRLHHVAQNLATNHHLTIQHRIASLSDLDTMAEDKDTIELITPGAHQLFKEFNMSDLSSTTKDWDAPQAGAKELVLGGAAAALFLIIPVYLAFRWI